MAVSVLRPHVGVQLVDRVGRPLVYLHLEMLRSTISVFGDEVRKIDSRRLSTNPRVPLHQPHRFNLTYRERLLAMTSIGCL